MQGFDYTNIENRSNFLKLAANSSHAARRKLILLIILPYYIEDYIKIIKGNCIKAFFKEV